MEQKECPKGGQGRRSAVAEEEVQQEYSKVNGIMNGVKMAL